YTRPPLGSHPVNAQQKLMELSALPWPEPAASRKASIAEPQVTVTAKKAAKKTVTRSKKAAGKQPPV
ncbi:MAG TPA: hypothetical protein VIM67_07260, partial [Terriglobus sp.]